MISLPWSAEETHRLAHQGRAHFSLIADADNFAALTIAATGHDGATRLRFPATGESVIAVGVCDSNLYPTSYCGTDAQRRKPELLVPSMDYRARGADGEVEHLGGTSAAVAVVTGLAALWCERLRGMGLNPSPALLRAALLASSRPSASPHHRIAAADEGLRPGDALFAVEQKEDAQALPYRFKVRCDSDGEVRVVAATRGYPRTSRWAPRKPELRLSARRSYEELNSTGVHWTLLEFAGKANELIDVEIEVDGAYQSLAVVVVGAWRVPENSVTKKRSPRPLTIVGISASHNASACLMRDGKIEVAVQLERLTRRKYDGVGFLHSREPVDYCLQSLGITAKDVDIFSFNAQPLLPGWTGLSQPYADEAFDLFDPFGERAFFVSHHLAHAFAAFSASTFDSAAVLVCDGSGGATVGPADLMLTGAEFKKYLNSPPTQLPKLHVQSTYLFQPEGFELIDRELAESFNVRCGSSSIGEVYAAISQYIFGDWKEGGKLMGLAPYGDAQECGPTFLWRDEKGRLHFRDDWKNAHRKASNRENPLAYRHLAARVQKDLEEAVLDRVRRACSMTKQNRLVFSGGLALNSVVNEKICRLPEVKSAFFLPAGNDAGIALGAAAAAAFHVNRSTARTPQQHDFLGHPYGEEDYRVAINEFRYALKSFPLDLEKTAEQIAEGRVIGWFDGASEFGPRALGHRSILADARDVEMWKRVNADIKYREDFRPLAPIVPVELASVYFELDDASPYMLRVVKVRREYRKRLGAVCHVDGTARVQTVDNNLLPSLHRLLHLVGERTGMPVMVNTSLNRRGEPLIETPLEAIEMLLSTSLDGLVLGKTFVAPKRPAGGALLGENVIMLSPDAKVICESSLNGTQFRIEGRFGEERTYALHPWCAALLMNADGKTTLAELQQQFLPADVDPEMALALIEALYQQRLLMVTR
jgi:carbamoyltransferase